MKNAALLLLLLLLSSGAYAGSVTPPGSAGQIVYNNQGKWGATSTPTVTGVSNNSITLNPSYVPNNTNLQVYGPLHLFSDASGLTYNLSQTLMDPSAGMANIVLTEPGTYYLSGTIQTAYVGSTFSSMTNAQCVMYRTNNTASNISDTTSYVVVPVMTTTTLQGPTIQLGNVSYTTSNTSDSLILQCAVTTIPSVGNYQVTAVHISAVRGS